MSILRHVPPAVNSGPDASFADDLLAALQSDDFTPTYAIPGAEPRPSVSGEQEVEAWDERWAEYAAWSANLERFCTDPDPWGESCYFGAWGGHQLD